jgi:hypothetical protein
MIYLTINYMMQDILVLAVLHVLEQYCLEMIYDQAGGGGRMTYIKSVGYIGPENKYNQKKEITLLWCRYG